ncbi:MAG: hypothetical protein VB133_09565 [Anaeromusa sp.]|uniref:hypothetical protein n=1 Tax=Anaeromusa sp. TaxID=1872520 RepID=UPI002B2154D2|nr:hypothetical protein [Anaeromusa sp.]MEA4835371.1 hypothetical protein [Anaeromusa sp.]
MSTLAELLIKISGNSSGLDQELAKSQANIEKAFSTNPINSFTDAVSGATGNLNGMIGKITGLTALAAGGFGLGAIVDKAVAAGESVYQLSTRMGITSAEASNLNRVLKLTGGDSDTFASAMMRLDKNFSASGESGDKTRAVLESFGVHLTDSTGKLLPLNQQLAEMSKGYKLAEQNGLQQEFVMQTLGAKGMALVKTLKDYDEASQNAAKVKGVGLDPAQMHELQQTMRVVELQASQVGLAFASALAPVAKEVFPAVAGAMTGIASTLSENKAEVIDLTKDVLEMVVAYKGVQMAATAGTAIQTFWQNAAAAAAASTTAQALSSAELTAVQERSIARAVAASNRGYAKMEADAVKAAQAQGLSAQETAIIIAEECAKISAAATEAAAAIRVQMTESFALVNAEAAASAVAVSEAFAAQGLAATAAGEKAVAANVLTAESSRAVALAQEEVAAANVIAGNTGVVAGEKMVGSLAVAEAAAISMSRALWTLIGGWLGLVAAMGYGAYKAYEYGQNMQADYTKKYGIQPDNNELSDGFHEQTSGNGSGQGTGDYKRDEDSNTLPPVETYSNPAPAFTMPDLSGIGGKHGGGGGGGKGSGGIDKVTKEAMRVHEAISKEWVNTTQDQMAQVDAWYSEEVKKLNESASANEHYQEDLQKLNETYSRKKIKALYEEEKARNAVFDSTYDSARSLQERMGKLSLPSMTNSSGGMEPSKVAADLQSIDNEYTAAITKIQNKYRDLEGTYEAASAREQAIYRDAWAKNGIDFEINEQGKVSFKKQIDKESVASEQEKDQKIRAINVARKQWEEAQESARNAGNIAAFQATLSNEQALLAQDLAGRQQVIDAYYAAWKETHRTSMSYMAQGIEGLGDGFKTFFSNAITGADNAWASLGQSFTNTIANMVSEWLAARIKMAAYNMLGISNPAGEVAEVAGWGAKTAAASAYYATKTAAATASETAISSAAIAANAATGAASMATGAAVGAAWAPAAAMVSLATLGANSAPAMAGMAAASAMAMGLSVAGFRDGGLTQGAGTGTSDSILAWLSHGEFVMTAAATKAWGANNLAAMNAGRMPRFASGGIVAGPSLASLGGGSIRTASLPTLETKSTGAAAERGNTVHVNLSAMDAKSVKNWLENGGGDMIMSYANKKNKMNPYGKR